MTITVYEPKQVKITLPAYYRKKGENVTNWYLAISEKGCMMTSNGTNGNVESPRPDAWLDSTYEPCSPEDFFEALYSNTQENIAKQTEIARKWGNELEGGAYVD